ncbi:MAG: adenosylmethionine--8-amino-7-oxononanoate transaminase [Endozoicomonas sp.]|uniref:adenosylmethionine--8-amino-7-oxononanoate transaminase n=1 Tax=Endozoicomonas sp. TaxID=1892382 RepID=UPI003D9BE07B
MKQQSRSTLWHAYSALGGEPLKVTHSQGIRLTLNDGRELLDGTMGWWAMLHGYSHPYIEQKMHDQLATIPHVPMFSELVHEPAERLADRLTHIAPGNMQAVFFSESGSSAVEVAMKMALQYWRSSGKPQKNHFATLRNGFHGDTFGSMSLCGSEHSLFSEYQGIVKPAFQLDPPPLGISRPFQKEDLASTEQLLEKHHHEIAALFVEPLVQGYAGLKMYSPEYLKALHDLCKSFDILFVADEVAAGFVKTGSMFACDQAQISPDLMCLAKSLTGGMMSMGATLASSLVLEVLGDQPFMHGATYMATALGCAAGNANLDLLETGQWQADVARIAHKLKTGLAECSDIPGVTLCQSMGLLAAVSVEQEIDTARFRQYSISQGATIRCIGKTAYLAIPINTTSEDIEFLTHCFKDCLKTVAI